MHRRIRDSPLGPLTLVGDGETLSGLYFPGHWTHPDPAAWGRADDASFAAAEDQLREYFAGERTMFSLPLMLAGTAFQREVWSRLAAIPHGATTTYRELAVALGRPGHARAVGSAVRTNPISVIVPCHRVLGSTGGLTGYAGGLERKAFLLAHEGARAAAPHDARCTMHDARCTMHDDILCINALKTSSSFATDSLIRRQAARST